MVWKNPKAREGMIAAFTDDQEFVAKSIFDEAKEEGEEETPAEPPAQEEQEEKQEPAAPAQQEPAKQQDDLEEHRRALAAQNEAYLNQMNKQLEAKFGHLKDFDGQQRQPAEPDYRKMYEDLEAKVTANQEALEKITENSARENFNRAVAELATKYGDLDEFVAPATREAAFRDAMKAKAYGLDWTSAIAQVYKINSHDKYFSAPQQKSDELASKREEKRQQSLQAAKAVSPGGSQFQQPVIKPDVRKSNFASERRKALLAELG